uniref:Uncharacterized protein n=1 Tax=Glossina pallidipes TaxID=7398 RepID=A0A1A9ZTI8_GLOPL
MQRRMSVTIREYKFFRSFSQKFENWPKRKAEALWRKMRERKIAEIKVFRSKAADHSLSKSALNNNKYKILPVAVSEKFTPIIFIIISIEQVRNQDSSGQRSPKTHVHENSYASLIGLIRLS